MRKLMNLRAMSGIRIIRDGRGMLLREVWELFLHGITENGRMRAVPV